MDLTIFCTSEGETAQQAGSLLGLDVFHLTGVQTFIPTWCVGQQQLQGHVGALWAGLHRLWQGPLLQRQRAAGLHRCYLLWLWGVGQTVPGEITIDQPVRLAPQNHMLLLYGLIGWGHAHLKTTWQRQTECEQMWRILTRLQRQSTWKKEKHSAHVSHGRRWCVNPPLLCWQLCICTRHEPQLSESSVSSWFSVENHLHIWFKWNTHWAAFACIWCSSSAVLFTFWVWSVSVIIRSTGLWPVLLLMSLQSVHSFICCSDFISPDLHDRNAGLPLAF